MLKRIVLVVCAACFVINMNVQCQSLKEKFEKWISHIQETLLAARISWERIKRTAAVNAGPECTTGSVCETPEAEVKARGQRVARQRFTPRANPARSQPSSISRGN